MDNVTLFIYRHARDAKLPKHAVPLPAEEQAIVISSSVSSNHDKRFLYNAPKWLVPRIIWSLLGPTGRLYVMLSEGTKLAAALDCELSNVGWSRYTLSFTAPAEAEIEYLWWAFFNITVDGVAVGFVGKETPLEQEIRSLPLAIPAVGPDQWPALHRSLLYTALQQKRDDSVGPVPLVIYPWGSEDRDGIIIADYLSQDDLVERIHAKLADCVSIVELDAGEYEEWSCQQI